MNIVAQKKENSKRYLPHAISTKEGASNCGFTSQPVKDIGRPLIPYGKHVPHAHAESCIDWPEECSSETLARCCKYAAIE